MRRAVALAVVLALGAPLADAKPRPKPGKRHAKVYKGPSKPKRLFPSMRFTAPPPAAGQEPQQPETPPPPPPPPAPLPSRAAVDLDEYVLFPAYSTLAAGEIELNAKNLGEDDHDLTVEDAAHTQLAQVYLTPGAEAQVILTLPAGTYRLYCSLGDHAALGMDAPLTIS